MSLEPRLRRQLTGIAWLAAAALAAAVLARGDAAARDVGLVGGWLYRVLTTFLGRAVAPAAPLLAALYGALCLLGREGAARRVGWAAPLALAALAGWRQAGLPPASALDPRSWPVGGGLVGGLLDWALRTLVGPLGERILLVTLAAAALALVAGPDGGRAAAAAARRLAAAWGRAVEAVVRFVAVPEPVPDELAEAGPPAPPARTEEPAPVAPPRPAAPAAEPAAAEVPRPVPALEAAAAEAVAAAGAEDAPSRSAAGTRAPARYADNGRAGAGEVSAATPPASPGAYRLPPLSLLPRGRARGGRAARDVEQQARELEQTLASFGVQARVVGHQTGPAVTRFELEPAPGVKVSRIQSLASDIALRLAVPAVRIEAPIPGKRAVGIEVPHREVTPVLLRDVLESEAFQQSPSPLTVALGMDTAGQPVVTTLERLLHVLIAGATGSGKSVCVNAMITSLLFKARPDQVRLVLVDPKMVELSGYNGIPHLLAPVVTDPKRAAAVLKWLVREMERRYERFAEVGVRDVHRYNALAAERGEEPLPLIVVVIDELADLMMVAPVDVEDAIQRLAQMARAAGIHLVVATQRPSVDVITGVIKANIPSRIAFAVSSQTDSRVILDGAGAERLLGRGDMLFYPLGASKPVRVQGAYIGERELEAVLDFVRGQGEPSYREEVLSAAEEGAADEGEDDELFPEALRIVVETGQASVSLLQRRLRIGYTRAGRLIDMMEARGFVGPHQGSKARDVRITLEEYRRLFGDSR